MRKSNYDKYPATRVSGNIYTDWQSIRSVLEAKAAGKPHCTIVVECYQGVMHDELKHELALTLGSNFHDTHTVFRTVEEVEKMTAPWITDDRLFGFRASHFAYTNFLDMQKVDAMRTKIAAETGITIVYGHAAAKNILKHIDDIESPHATIPEWDDSQVTDSDEEVIITHNWHELRLTMWDYVGIVRTNKRLERAMHRIEMLKKEVGEYYTNFRVSSNLLELRNLLDVAEIIVRSAMLRHESRGLHYNLDYKNLSNTKKTTIL